MRFPLLVRQTWLMLFAIFLSIVTNSSKFANAQSDNQVFLPLIVKEPRKEWSGMHLGNRNGGLWETEMLDAIDPRDGDGSWPANLVILSNQLYVVNRSSTDECYVDNVVANPNAVDSGVFDYVKVAAQNNVRVIIRIYPSPGNFLDYDDPTWSNHRLSSGVPVGNDYCGALPNGRLKADVYRSPLDLALEMAEIQRFNNDEHGFEVYGFIPANEPNLEWYTNRPSDGMWPPSFDVRNPIIWEDMDAYFATVYVQVQDAENAIGVNVRMLTPTMTQNLFAEGVDFFSEPNNEEPDGCGVRLVGTEQKKGYELMPQTYGTTKNDGIAWHNYWIIGRETFNACENGGGHVSFYFPTSMRNAIHGFFRPPLILEADLASPRIEGVIDGGQVPVSLSDMIDKDADIERTSDSIRQFMQSEACFGANDYGADPDIATWLLSDNVPPGNPEHDWHEAYRDGPVERGWFTQWWTNDSETIYSCPEFFVVPTAVTMSFIEANSTNSPPRVIWSLLVAFVALISIKWIAVK